MSDFSIAWSEAIFGDLEVAAPGPL